ncbi:MAG: peptide ABC transporter substrate-binding protein [Oscillospiraceae bacterium]|nr:peptide ABC transporter substrate-binding protein [Oscillospiraceae bacterium]
MKKIINLVIILSLIFAFGTGCSEKDGSGYIFKYDIPVNPRTLDPQTATGKTEALIIANLFDGLLKVEKDGSITANVAKEYTVSEDNLTYTFILRDDVFWYYDGEYSVKCTAQDFVFAFRRLFNPAVKSENASLFYSIKNAKSVHTGEISSLGAIGVTATDDFKLNITLETPNPLLPYLLTTSPAMPCNEELFEKTAGRYGLNESAIPSNGAFYITRWNYDPYSKNDNIIIMRRNEKNSEASRIFPRGLNFFIDYEDPEAHFLEGTTHSKIAEGETAEFFMARSYSYDSFENAAWGITFNTRRVFRNEDLRYALAAGFDRNVTDIEKIGWREARELVPPIIDLGNQPYRIAAGMPRYIEYDLKKAREAYAKGVTEVGRENIIGHSIIIPVDEKNTAHEYLGRILQEWQVNLNFFCSIKALSEDEFAKAIADGDYDIAMVKLSGSYNSPDAYLRSFGGIFSRSTPTPLSEYNALLELARRTQDNMDSSPLFIKAEEMILLQAIFIPVSFQTEMFFYDRKSEGLIYNPFTGTVTFREAKYF